MLDPKKQYDYRNDVPVVIINWTLLVWLLMFIASALYPFLCMITIPLFVISAMVLIKLVFKRLPFYHYFNPRTDTDGNQVLMIEMGFQGTPGILFQDAQGQVQRRAGLPQGADLQTVLGPR